MLFSVAPGVFDALSGMNDNRAYYTFGGDLGQMGTIYRRLQEAGFKVVKSNVYPGFPREAEEEYKRALEYVYTYRVDGWWNQHEALLRYEICTEEAFKQALDIECALRR
jgi:hypothetical protein